MTKFSYCVFYEISRFCAKCIWLLLMRHWTEINTFLWNTCTFVLDHLTRAHYRPKGPVPQDQIFKIKYQLSNCSGTLSMARCIKSLTTFKVLANFLWLSRSPRSVNLFYTSRPVSCVPPAEWKAGLLSFPTVYDMPIILWACHIPLDSS